MTQISKEKLITYKNDVITRLYQIQNNGKFIFQSQFISQNQTIKYETIPGNQEPQTGKNRRRNNVWTEDEQKMLYSQYEDHGPVWSTIVTNFTNKTQNCLKNKFNIEVRKIVSLLISCQKQMLSRPTGLLNSKIINVIFEFSFQAMNTIKQLGLTLNKNSLIFRFRAQMLRLCLNYKVNGSKKQDMLDLISKLRVINSKLRSYQISKRRNLKGWKLNYQALQKFNQFDKIYLEDNCQYRIQVQKRSHQIVNTKISKKITMASVTNESVQSQIMAKQQYQSQKSQDEEVKIKIQEDRITEQFLEKHEPSLERDKLQCGQHDIWDVIDFNAKPNLSFT